QARSGAISAVLRPLVGPARALPRLAVLFAWLRDRLSAGDALNNLAQVSGQPAPASERDRALAILGRLAAARHADLCHTDASPWNLLTGEAGHVFLIDPRGVCGEVEYDVAVVALKAARYTPAAETVPNLANLVEVDPARVQAWLESFKGWG